jgi:hypothetical protein
MVLIVILFKYILLYIDPGSTTLLLQILISALLAILTFAKRIKFHLKRIIIFIKNKIND